MSKLIKFDVEALTKMQSGLNQLATAVKGTLGPGGKGVAIGKKYGAPRITKDGVSVAKEVELEDPIENVGAQLIKEASSKTNDDAGDGTTTAVVLAQAIFEEGIKNITAGASPIDVTLGIEKAIEQVKKEVKKQAKSITSKKEREQVATISANNDQGIGLIIADAMEKVGPKGVITVEEAKGTETEIAVVEGMQFDRGYHSPHFVNDQEKMITKFDNPYILITDQKITTFQVIVKIVENIAKTGRPLLIIGEDIDNEPLAGLIVNSLRGIIKTCFVKAPAFGDHRKAILEDIAVITGGTVITEEKGYKLENATLDYLGSAKTVKVDKESTTIVDGAGKKETIDAKISELEAHIQQTTSAYDKEKLEKRLGTLAQGIAVIHVGGKTEVEMQEKKDRIEDSLNATKAAGEMGILAGGGIALLRASHELNNLNVENEDQKIGVRIIQKALEKPLYTILENAVGVDKIYPIIHKIQQEKGDYGYNVRTHTFGSLHKLGVIEPTKVPLSALENAGSIVKHMLRTGCVIVDKPQKEKEMPPVGGPGGGMPGMM